jgi:SagB-type dehydrogenase family enzyme
MSAAVEYHRATNVPSRGTDEDEERTLETRPHPFKDYGEAERLPLDVSPAGPLLGDGARVLRSRTFPGGSVHFRAYSSAGALYPVETYVVGREGVLWFDALEPTFVRVGAGDARGAVAAAAAEPSLAAAGAVVVLTGIHWRTGWKYIERGYRHVWWDAGTMLANLLALAAADGFSPRLYTAFDDRELNEALAVDGVREYALAVLTLGVGS